MVRIIRKPDEMCFKNRIGEIELQADEEVGMTLSVDNGPGNEQIFRGSYIPSARGIIRIDVTELVKPYLATTLPTSTDYMQTDFAKTFNCSILGGSSSQLVQFTVVNAAPDTQDDASEWLASHFLTNQPQQWVTDDMPNYISLYEEEGGASLIGFFYTTTGKGIPIEIVKNLTPGCHTCDINYKHLMDILGTQHAALSDEFDIIIQRGEAAATRRFYHADASGREKYFLFVNRLGGIDTFKCTGENVLQPETSYETVETTKKKKQIQTKRDSGKWLQRSGWFPYKWRDWVHEIMTEQAGAWMYQNDAFTEIILKNTELAISDYGQLQTMTFEYTTAEVI